MQKCGICGKSSVITMRVPSARFSYCWSCTHSTSPPQVSGSAVLDYYKMKPKWDRFRQRFEEEGFVVPMEERYVERADFVVDRLKREGCTPSEASLLDVGTAAGLFLLALGDRLKFKQGTDLDAAAVRYASQVLKQPAINAELQDQRVLDHAPYDVVTSFHVLEHVVDPVAFVRGMTSLVRDGGLLFLAMPVISRGPKSISFYREYPTNGTSIEPDSEHIQHFTQFSASRLAARCGLDVLEQRVWSYKQADYLPEVFMALRKRSHVGEEEPQKTAGAEAWKMFNSLVYWSARSSVYRRQKRAA